MPQIEVRQLVKTFRVAKREPGLWGAFKGLVVRKHRLVTALDRIAFRSNLARCWAI